MTSPFRPRHFIPLLVPFLFAAALPAGKIRVGVERALELPPGPTPDGAISYERKTGSVAKLKINGEPLTYFTLSFPDGPAFLKQQGSRPILIKNYKAEPGIKGRFDDRGEAIVSLGAESENLPVSQHTGEYRGSFPVTVRQDNGARQTVRVKAYLRVIAATIVEASRSLFLGESEPGGTPDGIPPSDRNALTCTVRGQPHTAFEIHLPPANTILMKAGLGDTLDRRIVVEDLTRSSTAYDAFGVDGKYILRLGAAPAQLRLSQEAGNFTGYFEITVIYL